MDRSKQAVNDISIKSQVARLRFPPTSIYTGVSPSLSPSHKLCPLQALRCQGQRSMARLPI